MRLLYGKANRQHFVFEATSSTRRALTILTLAASINLSLPLLPGVFTAAGRNDSTPSGIIRVAGSVTIDGIQGTSGQTIFSGSQVITAERSESIIDLGKHTRFRLLPKTDFSLDFSRARVSSKLHEGTLRAYIPAGLPVSIQTAGGELVTDPGQAAEFILQVTGETTQVSVKTGKVELRSKSELWAVGAGEIAGGVFTNAGGAQDSSDDEDDGLSKKEKVGFLVAIGGAAALLLVVLRGREKQEELDFGGCVIILSGVQTCP